MSASPLVPLNTKLFYGIGQLSEGMSKISFTLFVLFFYTQLLGIPGYYTGTALCIALILDAFADLWMGVLSDQWHSKWGRRHPFMLVSALPLSLCFYLLFSPPEFLKSSALGLAAWLTVFATLTRWWTTVFQVPYLSLGAELSQNSQERTKIVGFRYAFSNIGLIITLAIGFSFFFVPTKEFSNGQMNPAAYSPFAFCLGLLMISSILISVFGTYKEIPRLVKATPVEKNNHSVLETLKHNGDKIKVALKNNSFRALLYSLIISFIMVGIVNNMSIFMLTFFWELNATEIPIIASIIFVGILGGGFLTHVLHGHLDKKHTVIYSVIGWITFLILPTCLRLIGWFPENGSREIFWILVMFRIMEGLCLVQAAVSFGSMIADITDEHALATGKREEGIFFGASSFASKCSDGFGTLAAGLLVDFIHFPTGANIKVTDIPADVLFQLGLFYGPFIVILAAASLWFCNQYDLNREKHASIQQELENKRL
jgi:GPH family glycoside/pentoside/hexuronide:cation symporter